MFHDLSHCGCESVGEESEEKVEVKCDIKTTT